MPLRLKDRINSRNSLIWIGSMPAKGSSSSRKSGVRTSERAISSRRRSPPESW
jgi:hypothetical protein